jgi:mono/diheme cytochrome c family protein
MNRELPITAVQEALRRRWRFWTPVYLLLALVFLIGLVSTALGLIVLMRVSQNHTPRYGDIVEHFKYGSIGAEQNSGIPYRVWRALPRLFPEAFEQRDDYAAFGFLYENDADDRPRDLPIGIARRVDRGVELVWFNCATCHTGTVTAPNGEDKSHSARLVVPAMPSNNLDLYRFIRFLLDSAADERLSPDILIPAINRTGPTLGRIEEAIYRWFVIPALREGLVTRRSRLLPLLDKQPPWGPGRVDTFNPYKRIQANWPMSSLLPEEFIGTADFPSIFQQGPREGMHLHWDGNNTSLAERNLSAALGAGVTPESVDHAAIDRVADWLKSLRPPPSPYRTDPAAVARGRDTYMKHACVACHGYQDVQGYVFKGEKLGQVELNYDPKIEPDKQLGTDPRRLDSYTERLRDFQLAELFKGTQYQFKSFEKTFGYANLPLDGLWLRAPYLHNGSIPTLADLLEPPEKRPAKFIRGIDKLDPDRGGFVAPACDGPPAQSKNFCFDTGLPGNNNAGHRYGTNLSPAEKSDLLAYLLTF